MSNWVSVPEINDDETWLSINLETRRVQFCYRLDSEGGVYRFSLLSECRADVQETLSNILLKNKIEIMQVSDCLDYYTIVTNSDFLIFER